MDRLREIFDIRQGEVTSLVGAGGKTTLMFALARELVSRKNLVVTTTTTKIFPPSPADTPFVFLSEDREAIKDFILQEGGRYGHITVASEHIASSGKLRGIDPELIQEICEQNPEACIIVEADGAAKRPLKAPNINHEPVIPQNSSLIIPVVGIEALGCRLTDEYVFRADTAARLSGTKVGEVITQETIATLLTHPFGMAYGSPVHARIIPFVNKMDLKSSSAEAKSLAGLILKKGHAQIDRVVLGQANCRPPEIEMISI